MQKTIVLNDFHVCNTCNTRNIHNILRLKEHGHFQRQSVLFAINIDYTPFVTSCLLILHPVNSIISHTVDNRDIAYCIIHRKLYKRESIVPFPYSIEHSHTVYNNKNIKCYWCNLPHGAQNPRCCVRSIT